MDKKRMKNGSMNRDSNRGTNPVETRQKRDRNVDLSREPVRPQPKQKKKAE